MNHVEASAAPQYVRALPRLLIGLTIMIVGLLWTLDNLDILESEPITQWWPVVVIAIGLVRLADPIKNKVASVLIALIGVGMLLDTLDYWDLDLGSMFPLLIALFGGKLVYDALRRRSARLTSADDPDAVVHAFAFMSGVARRSVSNDFRGGDANAFMGGTEIDLRNAQIVEGGDAVLDLFAFWGGIEIRVPENWRVVSEVVPVMGAYVDKTVNRTAAVKGPVLILRGTAIMGGIELKN